MRCSRDVTSVSVVGVGPVEIVAATRLLWRTTLSSALAHRFTMRDVMIGRVNWVASIYMLFLDICSTRPVVATHGEVVVYTLLSPTPFYLSSLHWREQLQRL